MKKLKENIKYYQTALVFFEEEFLCFNKITFKNVKTIKVIEDSTNICKNKFIYVIFTLTFWKIKLSSTHLNSLYYFFY